MIKEKYNDALNHLFVIDDPDAEIVAFNYVFNANDPSIAFNVVFVGDTIHPADYDKYFGEAYRDIKPIFISTTKAFNLPLYETIALFFGVAGDIEDTAPDELDTEWQEIAEMMYGELCTAKLKLKKIGRKLKNRKKVEPADMVSIMGSLTNLLINAENIYEDTDSFMRSTQGYEPIERKTTTFH